MLAALLVAAGAGNAAADHEDEPVPVSELPVYVEPYGEHVAIADVFTRRGRILDETFVAQWSLPDESGVFAALVTWKCTSAKVAKRVASGAIPPEWTRCSETKVRFGESSLPAVAAERRPLMHVDVDQKIPLRTFDLRRWRMTGPTKNVRVVANWGGLGRVSNGGPYQGFDAFDCFAFAEAGTGLYRDASASVTVGGKSAGRAAWAFMAADAGVFTVAEACTD